MLFPVPPIIALSSAPVVLVVNELPVPAITAFLSPITICELPDTICWDPVLEFPSPNITVPTSVGCAILLFLPMIPVSDPNDVFETPAINEDVILSYVKLAEAPNKPPSLNCISLSLPAALNPVDITSISPAVLNPIVISSTNTG